jgi:hypothetical protein
MPMEDQPSPQPASATVPPPRSAASTAGNEAR